MHWTYADKLDQEQLHQGDVLMRTPAVDALLKEVHPYFHSRADNLYFMVLTQTCDLVRRPKAKAEYIAICPVRPVSTIVRRALQQFVRVSDAQIPVGTSRDQQKFRDYLTRLLNNNEPGYFYLYRDDKLAEDCCAVTRLSISIRTAEHYNTCLAAKHIELHESFRAKLGWAVGNIYGRVGTKDWPADQLRKRLDELLASEVVWVGDEKEQSALLAGIDKVHGEGGTLDDAAIKAIKKGLVPKKDQLVGLVASLMEEVGVDESVRRKVERRLRSDPKLGQLVRA